MRTIKSEIRRLQLIINSHKTYEKHPTRLCFRFKPWYDDGDILRGQSLTHHIRKSSRTDVTEMFLDGNEQLFDIANGADGDYNHDYDYFPDEAEVAIDITDWPFFGDPDTSEFVKGTKSGRNFSNAWKYITLALVGTDTPLVLVVLPVKDKSKTPEYIRRMLRLSRQYLDIKRVYLDAGTEFYNSDTISTITEHGLELVMKGRKSGKEIKHFLNGMARADLHSSYHPYGVDDLDRNRYYAVGLKSEKTVKLRKSEPDEPLDNYVFLYTNVDPREIPSEELGEKLDGEKYITAGRLIQAIEDDPHELKTPTELPKYRQVFGDLLEGGWSSPDAE